MFNKQSRREMTWAEKGGCRPKPCKKCDQSFKPATSGNMYCATCVDGVRKDRCKKAMRTYRKGNRDHVRQVKARWDLKRYGLTEEDYLRMLTEHRHCCAICKTTSPGGRGIFRKFVVDHCHATGCIRGLLCPRCNTAIGLLRDDANLLAEAIKYLEKFQ